MKYKVDISYTATPLILISWDRHQTIKHLKSYMVVLYEV